MGVIKRSGNLIPNPQEIPEGWSRIHAAEEDTCLGKRNSTLCTSRFSMHGTLSRGALASGLVDGASLCTLVYVYCFAEGA